MKTGIKALLLSATLIMPFTTAQADDDYPPMMGYGPGMMGGYGSGMMGGDYGPGMMGGYGSGMMGGGYGPGMMGGYGPGMMGGYGSGMMGGYGSGMMGGYGMGINLSDDQINKCKKIHAEVMDDMFSTMNKTWKARNEMWKAMRSQDKKAIGKAFDNMSGSMKEMFMKRMEIQEKMQNILTKEQKEKLNNAYSGMMR